MDIQFIFISAAITIVSLVLFIIAINSYRVFKNPKLGFVTLVFLFFLIKGLLLSLGLLYTPFNFLLNNYYVWIIDLIILTLLYISALKR